MDEWMMIPLLSGVMLALVLGPLGSIIVWRRMAYFGDAMAHAALLGVALSLLSNVVPMPLSIFSVALLCAVALHLMGRDGRYHHDTLLGILAHGTLGLGVLLVAMQSEVRVDIEAYLFGDILAMDWPHAKQLAIMCSVLLVVMVWAWRGFVMLILDEASAKLHGVPVKFLQCAFMVMLAMVVALSIQLVGVLLLTAMLIIPAAAARALAQSPTQMAVLASLIGALSVWGGLAAAFRYDAPAAPAMVCASVALCLLCVLLGRLRRAG